ncbi:MAG: hypothetical protein LBU70_03935 [Chitinispirillales bacterium]|jgi:hypothetical protein|nr:hypothetical protein [Chitinispirillales bacterium]
MKISSFKHAILPLAASAIIACAFLLCEDPSRDTTLKWKMALDIPINMSFAAYQEMEQGVTGSSYILLDLGAEDIDMSSDILKILKKLTDCEAGYHLRFVNNTGVGLTLYGLLMEYDEPAAGLNTAAFYNFITSEEECAGDYGCVRLLGRTGIYLPQNYVENYPPSGLRLDADFCDLILKTPVLTWRWLARVGSTSGLSETEEEAKEAERNVNVQARIRVTGINSFDSLLAL